MFICFFFMVSVSLNYMFTFRDTFLFKTLRSNEKTKICQNVTNVSLSISGFPSSSQSEIRPGSSVALFCQLYYDQVSCDTLVRTEGVQLIWVNQAGVNLQTDSRYQISPSGQCNSTLTTTLLNEDHNREWRCQVKQRNEPKTSVTYTVKYTSKQLNINYF